MNLPSILMRQLLRFLSQQVLDSCQKLNRSGTDTLQDNSLETIRQMVASSLGITVLPCSA